MSQVNENLNEQEKGVEEQLTPNERIAKLNTALKSAGAIIKNAQEKEREHNEEKSLFIKKMDAAGALIEERAKEIEALKLELKELKKNSHPDLSKELAEKDDEISKLREEIKKANLDKDAIRTEIEGNMVSEAIMSAHAMKEDIIQSAQRQAAEIVDTAKADADKREKESKERAKFEADAIIVSARTEAKKIRTEGELRRDTLNTESKQALEVLQETIGKIEDIKDVLAKVGISETATLFMKETEVEKQEHNEAKVQEQEKAVVNNGHKNIKGKKPKKVTENPTIPEGFDIDKKNTDDEFNSSFSKLDSLLAKK